MTKKKQTLRDVVHPTMHGVDYFHSLSNPMEMSVQDYVTFRIKECPYPLTASVLHKEWQNWISLLKRSGLGLYENAANQASVPSKTIINGWIKKPNIKRKAITQPHSRALRSRLSCPKGQLTGEATSDLPSSQANNDATGPILPTTPLDPPQNVITNLHNAEEITDTNQSEETASSHPRSSRSSRSSSNSIKISLSPYAIAYMKDEFVKHFNEFKGESWNLSSGTIFDDIIYFYVLELTAESTIHSFVIDSIEAILSLFSDVDKQDIQQYVSNMDKALQTTVSLSNWKKEEINKFKHPPSKILSILRRGWFMEDSTEIDESTAFRRSLHQTMHFIYSVYEVYNFRLPEGQLEAWYKAKIWGFLSCFFDYGGALEYRPEFTSRASTIRKNIDRSFPDKQQQGKRVDASIICNTTRLELCAIEAGKVDVGPTGTKIMTDSRKLGKVMKDMYDAVCSNCPDNVKNELVIYGILFSGPRITFLSFRYMNGRFFRMHIESSICFPPTWDKGGVMSTTITSLIQELYTFKERLEVMSQNVTKWTQTTQGAARLDKPFVRTLTTPPGSPKHEK